MYSEIKTAVVTGLSSHIVRVEADISDGMPMFSMVGFLSAEVKESKERVRAALKNLGISLPAKRITVNISPASIKKQGTGFDLPIAIAIITALGIIESEIVNKSMIIGELGLDGRIHSTKGVLPMVLEAKEKGIESAVLPYENMDEAKLVPDISIIGVRDIKDVIDFFDKGTIRNELRAKDSNKELNEKKDYDFCDLNGMLVLRRASEIAASGMHNILMIGPPGSGKTMLAKTIPSILPKMDESEMLEITKIYSVCGMLGKRKGLVTNRPFRSPHHTISEVGLAGGGSNPTPGEISLAHGGILFLDELLEFRRSSIEILRQPLEDKSIRIKRANYDEVFPADFMLVTAMNPCPCGYYPDRSRCKCTSLQIHNYLSKLSQPILDRIDICVEAPALSYDDISKKYKNESSSQIRSRVQKVHRLTQNRYKGLGFKYNSLIPPKEIDKFCNLGDKEQEYIEDAYERLGLTARSYHKVLRVARTIADMDGKINIDISHLREALIYRVFEKEGAYAKV